ncbi:cupredoxin domain-containing protein [Haloarcula amylolytica]|uniref:Blue (Type 1) copper domain-containing protein n=1 Tax=Haloarcula amylolytica JCM 13557 TaxID=1227452 RepID=M0JZ02_9EURY|nr:plastocyanin/azurin family copper-binding protein [Haloarcula amylolytica]EMA14211.1 blue (type 1) copper domain-containing protein [Haloarcula amylolytica JCM 13557]
MDHSRRGLVSRVCGGISVALAGCLGLGGPETVSSESLKEEHDAVVQTTDKNLFVPETVTIQVDDSVVWYNNGDREHTVTAYDDGIPEEASYFDSGDHESEQRARNDNLDGRLRTGDTYSHTFEVPGEYEYFCIPHERTMIGTVVVEE